MIYDNVLELIGNTPLVKYNDNICLKLEYFNPSSSVKDRASYSMLKGAMDRGEINKDTVIIEPTSGNTGIGLAMCCAVLGLRLIICMPESMSVERRKNIAAYGAELVLTPKEKGMQGGWGKSGKRFAICLPRQKSKEKKFPLFVDSTYQRCYTYP